MSRPAFAGLAALALMAALAPLATAHQEPVPLPFELCGDQHQHHYTTGTSIDTRVVTSVRWRTTVQLFDSCPFDGEPDYGVGGAFLPAGHHGSYDANTGKWSITVCADDDVWGAHNGSTPVGLIVGIDSGGGNIAELAEGNGCVLATTTSGGSSGPGAAGGWWVFLTNRSDGVGIIAPTTGHIYDI